MHGKVGLQLQTCFPFTTELDVLAGGMPPAAIWVEGPTSVLAYLGHACYLD